MRRRGATKARSTDGARGMQKGSVLVRVRRRCQSDNSVSLLVVVGFVVS